MKDDLAEDMPDQRKAHLVIDSRHSRHCMVLRDAVLDYCVFIDE